MISNNTHIVKTDNFHDPWTWIMRSLIVAFFIGLTVYWEWSNMQVWYWKYLFLPVCILFIYLNPKDDLAIDSKYFYYMRRSIFPPFSRVIKYDLSRLTQIRGSGINTPTFEFVHLLGYGSSNSIELIFKDDTSVMLSVQIHREELNSIISKVDELIKKTRSV